MVNVEILKITFHNEKQEVARESVTQPGKHKTPRTRIQNNVS